MISYSYYSINKDVLSLLCSMWQQWDFMSPNGRDQHDVPRLPRGVSKTCIVYIDLRHSIDVTAIRNNDATARIGIFMDIFWMSPCIHLLLLLNTEHDYRLKISMCNLKTNFCRLSFFIYRSASGNIYVSFHYI